MSSKSLLFAFLFLHLHFHAIQPFTSTIPAFPEQSDTSSGCSLNIPAQFFPTIKAACSTTQHAAASRLHYSRCCPVLGAWLLAAYSETALGAMTTAASLSYDLPQLPDESETCGEKLEKEMKERKMELIRPNETCDVVYCYCGIRLHPLSCPGAFRVDKKGKMVGDERVKKLEGDCLATKISNNGCSKCLNTLYQLHDSKNTSEDSRSGEIHKMKDCELMGLTWLLAKNTSAYVHTVSSVLRAIMTTASDPPLSCTLNSDGLPLAVDSSQIPHISSSAALTSSKLAVLPLLLLYSTILSSSI